MKIKKMPEDKIQELEGIVSDIFMDGMSFAMKPEITPKDSRRMQKQGLKRILKVTLKGKFVRI